MASFSCDSFKRRASITLFEMYARRSIGMRMTDRKAMDIFTPIDLLDISFVIDRFIVLYLLSPTGRGS